MFKRPDVDDVVAVAAGLGIGLTRDEAVLYQPLLVAQLEAFDAFVQSRDVDEGAPPVLFGAREAGYRPSDVEDPLGAWLWRCRIEGAAEGLLAGKTVSYKDHTAVAGIPLTFGSFVMEGFVPDFDATVVTRVLEAGGTIVGKNTTIGFVGGYGLGGSIGDYAVPRNPHDPSRVPGGSSSGSAIAVALGEVDISFGGDQGGSIRIPAVWSGTVGLKPTFGLVSHFGAAFGTDLSIDHIGPLTRHVVDAAVALEAVAGYDGLDPRQGREVPERMDVLGTLDDGVAGLRIGVLEEGFRDAEPDVAELVMAAVDVLAEAGAVISTVSIPEHLAVGRPFSGLHTEGARALFDVGVLGAFAKTYYPPSLIAAVNRMWQTQADLLSPRYKFGFVLAELSRQNFHGRVYAKAQNQRRAFVRAYDAALADLDVLVMPTVLVKAIEAGGPPGLEGVEHLLKPGPLAGRPLTNTLPFNYTGHPALAVPCGKSQGLPVSLQLVGRHFDDPLLLRIASTYEHSVDWDDIISVPNR